METALSARLRDATREAHTAAEGAPFMRRLLRGEIDRAEYAELLENLLPVYTTLERELARGPARERLAGLALDGLARRDALVADLATLGGPRTPRETRPATHAYVARLAALNDTAPVRLAAHAYVRYLGDLAGGRILARVVGTKLGAPVGFYDFGGADHARPLAQRFRAGLDLLPLEAAEADAVVDEALWAFRQHERLFGELDARRR